MEYISAEEFLKQPIEVQKVFIDWWKPSVGDLVVTSLNWLKEYEMDLIGETDYFNIIGYLDTYTKKEVICPLLTEGQLRKFIEDKTESNILRIFLNEFEVGTKTFKRYCIHLTNARIFMNQSDSLFQAYWKVACQIASKED